MRLSILLFDGFTALDAVGGAQVGHTLGALADGPRAMSGCCAETSIRRFITGSFQSPDPAARRCRLGSRLFRRLSGAACASRAGPLA